MSFKYYFSLLVSFFGFVSVFYLIGFWGSFGINVLEYANIQDVFRFSIYPLLLGSGSMLFGYLIGMLTTPKLEPGGGANSDIGKFGIKHWKWIVSLVFIVSVVILNFVPEPIKWVIFAAVVSTLGVGLTHIPILIELLPNPFVRARVLPLVVFLPIFAFAVGRTNAFDIKAGLPKIEVDVLRSNINMQVEANHPVAYLGYVDGCHFLYETCSGNVCIYKQNGNTVLFLNPRK